MLRGPNIISDLIFLVFIVSLLEILLVNKINLHSSKCSLEFFSLVLYITNNASSSKSSKMVQFLLRMNYFYNLTLKNCCQISLLWLYLGRSTSICHKFHGLRITRINWNFCIFQCIRKSTVFGKILDLQLMFVSNRKNWQSIWMLITIILIIRSIVFILYWISTIIRATKLRNHFFFLGLSVVFIFGHIIYYGVLSGP